MSPQPVPRRPSRVVARRSFLQSAAAGVAAAASGFVLAGRQAPLAFAGQGAAPASGGEWIDAHSHIWTTDLARFPLARGQRADVLKPASFTAEELLAICRPLGVERVVLIQHKPYHGCDNRLLAAAMEQYPGVFSGVACIEAGAPSPDVEMLRLKRLGFRGFRIRPGEGGAARWADSEGMRRMWASAATHGLAICPLIDPTDLPEVGDMAARFPDTRVVVDHLARLGMAGPAQPADVAQLLALAKSPHVFVKISAFYALAREAPYESLAPLIQQVFQEFGPQRLMWGSDCPYQLEGGHSYARSLELMRSGLPFLDGDARNELLRGTAERVFFP